MNLLWANGGRCIEEYSEDSWRGVTGSVCLYKGAYIKEDYGGVAKPSQNAQDPEIAGELWKTTESFLESTGRN